MNQTKLTNYQINKRKLILEGNLIKAILFLAIPIAITSIFFQLLPSKIDLLFSSKQPDSLKDTLPIFNTIKTIIFYFGVSLAMASTALISYEYSKGNYKKAFFFIKNTLYILVICSLFLFLLSLFLQPFIVKSLVSNTDYQSQFKYYYLFLMSSGILLSFNTVFFGLLRITGNIKIIYLINFLFLFFKIVFNFIFARYVYTNDVFFAVGLSTFISIILSNILLFFCIMKVFKREQQIHQFNKTDLKLNIYHNFFYFKSLFKFLIPIFLSPFIYELGRLIIFWQIKNPDFYKPGTITVYENGDLLAGFGLQFGFALQEGLILIISENLGNNNLKRAFKTVSDSLKINFIFGFFYSIFIILFGPIFLSWFGYNYSNQIRFCIFVSCFSGFCLVVFPGILLKSMIAFQKPFFEMYYGLLRIVIRLPLILLLRYFPKGGRWSNQENGWQGYGFANVISNFFVLLLIVYFYMRAIKKILKNKTIIFKKQ